MRLERRRRQKVPPTAYAVSGRLIPSAVSRSSSAVFRQGYAERAANPRRLLERGSRGRSQSNPYTPRTRFMQSSNGCATGNADGEWKGDGPVPIVVNCEDL